MSYTPTTWQTGDTITAEKLNNMESGIENANNPFIVTLTPTAEDFSGTMDKTCGEISAAYEAGKTIAFKIYTNQVGSYIVSKNVFAVRGSGATRFGFFANTLINGIGLISVYTGVNPPSDRTTYSTTIYPLTPMS